MNEVKKVHLGRQQFTISVEAHKELRDYLAAIEKQPGVQAEVSKEVELRMAELLTERGISADKVVLAEDVTFLKEQLGEPRDFKDDTAEATNSDTKEDEPKDGENRPKRLFRDTQNAWLAGVASGLAAYIGIDVLFVRIAFVLLTFASGAGILLYVLIWLLAPEAKTPSDRLQMQGKAVTVDSLKQVIDRADIAGVSERASRNIGRGIGKVLETFFEVILGIIGVGVLIAGVAVMLGTVAMCVYMLVHGGQVGTEIAFPLGSQEVWFTVLAFLSAAIIGFFLFMTGLTMITRKWRLPGWLTVALVGIFIVSAGVSTALGFNTIPHIRDRYRAAHHTQSQAVSPFTKLSLEGQDTRFVFKPDSKYYVELSYLGNVDTRPIQMTVDNDRLTINTDDFMRKPLCSGVCFYNDHDLVVTIHAPKASEIRLTGPDDSFFIEGPLQQDVLTLIGHRYSFGTVRLTGNTADTAVLTDNNNASERSLVLGGIKPTAGDDSIHMDRNMVNIRLTEATTVQLLTTASCDEGSPLVYLDYMPGQLMVNDKAETKAEAFRTQRSSDRASVYNCLALEDNTASGIPVR